MTHCDKAHHYSPRESRHKLSNNCKLHKQMPSGHRSPNRYPTSPPNFKSKEGRSQTFVKKNDNQWKQFRVAKRCRAAKSRMDKREKAALHLASQKKREHSPNTSRGSKFAELPNQQNNSPKQCEQCSGRPSRWCKYFETSLKSCIFVNLTNLVWIGTKLAETF